MSALLNPVGPKSARVYWVRRALVAAVLVAVVAVLLVVANSLLGRSTADGSTPAPSGDAAAATDGGTEEAPDGEDAAGADGPVACGEQQLAVALTADARSYAAGSDPVFTVTLTNTSDASCTIEAGEAAREILISSGSDRIWSSTDCLAEPEPRQLLLAADARDEVALTWKRERSDKACSDDLPAPRAGTYTATATLAGVSSTEVVFELGD